MSGGMSSFQKKADRILRENGWEFIRYTSKGYTMYINGERSTTVASSPKNPTDALKQVCKFAGIKYNR